MGDGARAFQVKVGFVVLICPDGATSVGFPGDVGLQALTQRVNGSLHIPQPTAFQAITQKMWLLVGRADVDVQEHVALGQSVASWEPENV